MTLRILLVAAAFACFEAIACPLCLGNLQSSTAERLVDTQRAVLARPEGGAYRVVEVIKGKRPAPGMIDDAAVQLRSSPDRSAQPLLLLRDEGWPMWMSVGAVGIEHAHWLRGIAAGKHHPHMSADDWNARV